MANPPYSFSSENPVTTLTLGPKAPYIQQLASLGLGARRIDNFDKGYKAIE